MTELAEIGTGLVATVLDYSQLALNKGASDGIQRDDVVVVLRSVEVRDPETKQLLGTVQLPKLRLRVNLVSDEYCTAVVIERAVNPYDTGVSNAIAGLKLITALPVSADDYKSVHVRAGDKVRFLRNLK